VGNLWVPSPRVMKELWNRWPSTLARTFTSPRIPKYSADPGITTQVQPKFFTSLFGGGQFHSEGSGRVTRRTSTVDEFRGALCEE
jgi:hypothetical protein